jgi:hypothetical protein
VIKVGDNWRAQVRRKGFKAQCRTFAIKAKADAWVRQVETDMDAGTVAPQLGALTVSEVIAAYRKLREQARPISDTSNEHYMLKTLEARPWGKEGRARSDPTIWSPSPSCAATRAPGRTPSTWTCRSSGR